MNITDQFEVDCLKCLDSGEYFDGRKMVTCTCNAGKKLKEKNGDDREEGETEKVESDSN